MHIVLLYLTALVVLVFTPGWKTFAVSVLATATFLVVIFMDEPAATSCSGQACGGAMAGYLIKGQIMAAFWFVFLIVAALRALRLSVKLNQRPRL